MLFRSEEWQAIEQAIRIVNNNRTNLRIADALEIIADICESHCDNCPLAIEGTHEDYCVFDCNNETMRKKIAKLRGE